MTTSNNLSMHKLPSPQNELQVLYNLVLDHAAKLINTFTSNDILHALANMTNISIDLKKMTGSHRTQLINDSIAVITSSCYNPEHMTSTQLEVLCKAAGRSLSLKGLTPAKRNNMIQDCISVLRNTQSISCKDTTTLQQLSIITGVFLPRGSLNPRYKHGLASTLLQTLVSGPFDDKFADLNSIHVLKTHFNKFNPNILYKQDEKSGTLHPYLLNQQISITQRRELLLDTSMLNITDWSSLPKFKSEKWCAAENNCVNDILPADGKYICSNCTKPTHADCGNRTELGTISCYQCTPKSKSVWNCLSNGYWNIEQQEETPLTSDPNQSILTVNTSTSSSCLNESLLMSESITVMDTPVEQSYNKNDHLTLESGLPPTLYNYNDKTDTMVLDSGLTSTLEAITDTMNLSEINEDQMNTTTTETIVFENGLHEDNAFQTSNTTSHQTMSAMTQPTCNERSITLTTVTNISQPMTTDNSTPNNIQETQTTTMATSINNERRSVRIVETNNNTTIIPGNRFTTRMEVRIPYSSPTASTTSAENPDYTAIKLTNLQILLNQIIQVDNSISILPWKDKDPNAEEPHQSLQGPFTLVDGPMSLEELSTYFNRIQFTKRSQDNNTWIDFRLEHSLTWKELQLRLGRWLQYRNYGLYPRKIQEEEEATIGWLLWSFREIDADHLSRVLLNDHGIEVALRWSAIRVGKSTVTPESTVRALHVITAPHPDEQDRITKKLVQIYHIKRTSFPLGIRLRFVGTPTGMDYSLINKIKQCRADQLKGINNLEHERYNGIDRLDVKMGNLTTLREQIMMIKAPANPQQSLFVSVNQQYNNHEKVVFSFRKRDAQDARSMIPAIRTYVINSTKNKDYGQYFNKLAKIHSRNFSWDDQQQTVTIKSNTLVPDEAIAEDIIFWGLDILDTPPEDPNNANANTDDDTILTSNTKIDNMSSSVKTFTTGQSSQNITGRFDDASTIASVNSSNTETSIDSNMVPNEIITLRRELTKLTNSVTLLKVNDQTRAEESKTILGKMEHIEKTVIPPSTTAPPTGYIISPSGSTP
jgi:hypothetical protein